MFVGAGWAGRDASGFEVGDLPAPGGHPLVDAGVAEGPVDHGSVIGADDCCARGDNGNRADHLDLDIGEVHAADDQGAIFGAVELHGFGVDLAGPGDADVILRQQLIHGSGIAANSGGPPLLFEVGDLLLRLFAVVVVGGRDRRRLRQDDQRKQEQPGAEE